jgi:hypothetical protein
VIDLRHGRWEDVLGDVECDALIVDAPYSDRTHKASRIMPELRSREISYSAWSPEDVHAFVASWSVRTRGWMATLTDHVLAPHWEAAFEAAGRYSFSPIACVEPGKTIRMVGDGPAQWSCFLVVARPRSKAHASWGALPGAYVVPGGQARPRKSELRIGGKPLWLMRSIVRDYSREGDLVCDPCAGGATTLLAAKLEGRRAVGAEQDADAYAQAMEVITHGYGRSPKQEALFT